MWKEVIGIIATLFIVIAFTQTGELKIRILDTIGAALFVVYGLLIASFSTIVLNIVLIAIQAFKIRNLRRQSL